MVCSFWPKYYFYNKKNFPTRTVLHGLEEKNLSLRQCSMVPKYDLEIVLRGPDEKVIPRDPAQWSQGGHFHSGTCSMVGLLLETLIPGGLKTSGLHIFLVFR